MTMQCNAMQCNAMQQCPLIELQITESWNELTYYISTKCFLGKIINEPFILHFP